MREPEVLKIAHLPARAALHLKSWVPGRSSPAPFSESVTQHCRLLTLAPGEWLLISDTLARHTLQEHAAQAQKQGIAAVNLSPGLGALHLEGPASRDVLSKSCGLDLHPSSFPVGTCTRTRLAQLPVIIELSDVTPRFELYVGRSYLAYLFSWLNDAAVGIQQSAP